MTVERLAYLALKEIIKNERREGEIVTALRNKGIDIADSDARDIANYIVKKNFGKPIWYPKNRVLICANLNALEFVKKNNNMTLDKKIQLIYSDLTDRPGRKGHLEDLLNRLNIEHVEDDIPEFVNHFKRTGFVRVITASKDGHEIMLTQLGLDYLNGGQLEKQPLFSSESSINYNFTNSQIGAVGHNASV